MPTLSVTLFGTFQAKLDGRPVASFESNKVRALLAYLMMAADRPISRDELVGLLWPNQLDAAARANLSQALANLRRTIGDRITEPVFVLTTRDTVRFNPASHYYLDTADFAAQIETCTQHVHRNVIGCPACVKRLVRAVGLYQGALLEHYTVNNSAAFEDWLLFKREEFRQQMLTALQFLAASAAQHGEHDQAHRYALRQIQIDPGCEEAHRQAMRALARLGQHSAALAQYQVCQQTLLTDFNLPPTPETSRLYDRIRNGLFNDDAAPDNLPPLVRPFFGREHELTRLAALCENPLCQLITLVGPGGVGKTQLALHAAAAQMGAFADGIHYVSLAAIDSAVWLPTTIAQALGLPLDMAADRLSELAKKLSTKAMLIVLDNFEQTRARGRRCVGRFDRAGPGRSLHCDFA